MDPGSHSNPIAESISHSAQRAAQLISISVAAAQGFALYRSHQAAIRAAEDEQEQRALRDQERRMYQQARLGWAPALDARWLAQADLVQTARCWGAAAVYAETDNSAATAILAAENRLRALHPYAMTQYDRLRMDRLSPIDAMLQAAPFFTRHPFAREGEPGRPRAALTTGPSGDDITGPGYGDQDDLAASPAGQGVADFSLTTTTEATRTTIKTSVEVNTADAAALTSLKQATLKAATLARQCFPGTASQALRAAARADRATSTAPRRNRARHEATRPRITG